MARLSLVFTCVVPVAGLVAHSSSVALPAESRLMAAQSKFHSASSQGLSQEEKAIEHAIAQAMKSPSQVGRPDFDVAADEELSCLPDVARCPKGWDQDGNLCRATAAYAGPCSPSVALFDMTQEERLAFARYCQASWHCQADCTQNFGATCPSLWKEIGLGVCEAPSNYVGGCAHRVHTDTMSTADKSSFGLKCGARWPCKTSLPEQCEKDYAASCPHGWHERVKAGKAECVSPATYEGCSPVQSFGDLTPLDKQRWESNCGQYFPCKKS